MGLVAWSSQKWGHGLKCWADALSDPEVFASTVIDARSTENASLVCPKTSFPPFGSS